MGTNFYLMRVAERPVHDVMHIAKRSAGWRIHFQDSEDGYDEPWGTDAPEPPTFHSVREIRELLETGEWQLATEEYEADGTHERWAPGAESLAAFDELCRWNGGPHFTRPAVEKVPDAPYDNPPGVPYDHGRWPGEYRDPDGYAFGSRSFC